MLKFGLLINPRAGIGGSVALKGSDGVYQQALERGGQARGQARAHRALQTAATALNRCRWLTWGAAMGEAVLADFGIDAEVLGSPGEETSAADTAAAVRALSAAAVDLLVFAGGDGTARDILDNIDPAIPVLGIPAGVKMHSGVFATTPERAGELIRLLLTGGMVQAAEREVRDLDERALREGRLEPRYFGELKVPLVGGYLQHTKESGRENEALAVEEIVADVVERLQDETRPVILGPGSTLQRIKLALDMSPSLLGMDVWQQGEQLGKDVDERWLNGLRQTPIVILSFTRAQGFLLGRGNQQLSAGLLARLSRNDLWVVGTRTKLKSLDGRPLLLDTDNPELDARLCGLVEITTGYQDRLFYRLDCHA